MTYQRSSWRLIFTTYPCPTCGAKPGRDCRTVNGHVASQVHAARTAHAERCPRCGTHISADDEPGSYCARCQLLRALEIERATKYRRRT